MHIIKVNILSIFGAQNQDSLFGWDLRLKLALKAGWNSERRIKEHTWNFCICFLNLYFPGTLIKLYNYQQGKTILHSSDSNAQISFCLTSINLINHISLQNLRCSYNCLLRFCYFFQAGKET